MRVSPPWMIWRSARRTCGDETWCEGSLGHERSVVWATPLSVIKTKTLKIIEVNESLCQAKGGWYRRNLAPVCLVASWCNGCNSGFSRQRSPVQMSVASAFCFSSPSQPLFFVIVSFVIIYFCIFLLTCCNTSSNSKKYAALFFLPLSSPKIASALLFHSSHFATA